MFDERHPMIKPRRVSFEWEDTALHWIPGDPVGTHLVNVFHVLLPAGERWFIEVVKDATPEVTDPRLREEIKGFIGQEMIHARSHQGVLERLLERHGIGVKKITDIADAGNADRRKRRATMPARKARRQLMFELAAVAAIEHYTAVLGQWIMDNTELDRAGADPTMLDLLRWHGAEEIEHRSVVFDVYQRLGGGYALRVAGWAVALFFLYWALIGGSGYIMRQDPVIGRRVTPLRAAIAYRRSVRRGHVPPMLRLLLREGLVYLKLSHHPSKVCSTQRAVDYLARSPAARAAGYDPY